MAKRRNKALQKLQSEQVHKALQAARKTADRKLTEYLAENTKWAKNLEGIKSRRDHQLDKLVVTN